LNETENVAEVPLNKTEDTTPSSVLSLVMSSIQNLNPLNYVPHTFMSWIMEGTKESEHKTRQKRGTNDVDVEKVTTSVVKDIRNLFSIISFLDISRCLEKMVCEIHTRGSQLKGRELRSTYEGNIITAFR
jgi:hypothetical protein